jgi:hypothetical protein
MVRFCRYLDPRPLFTTNTLHVNEEDAKALLPWFHQFGMTNLLEECDERLCISSPKILDDDLSDVDHQRSTMTEILVRAETATTYGLSRTLDAMMKELKNAVKNFPEMITTEILESMRPFWSTAAGTELWEAVKAILPDDVNSGHSDAALKANKLLFESFAQSCKVPAQIRTLKSDFNAIVNLIKKHRSCPRIQQHGCAAFYNLVLQNDDNHIRNSVKDGIEVILSAMSAHNNVSKVQEQGCAAIMNLALRSDANRVSIAAKHGIEAVVSAMAAHIHVVVVQEFGCAALGNLACNDENCVLIATKHGIETVVSAMTAHNSVSKVQEWGCVAIANLAWNNDDYCVSIATKHGIEAVLSAMTAHKDVLEVQECGCLALFKLSFNESVAVRIQLKRGLAVLEHNPSNSDAKSALQRIKALIILG